LGRGIQDLSNRIKIKKRRTTLGYMKYGLSHILHNNGIALKDAFVLRSTYERQNVRYGLGSCGCPDSANT
jgi:hypothetical protein